jgi:HJR/Mrr/RecB family endonuclease
MSDLIGAVATALGIKSQVEKRTGSKELWDRFDRTYRSSSREFEQFVADLFSAVGYESRVVGASGDMGVDVLLEKDGKRIAVQCKRYRKPAGIQAVQEAFTGQHYHDANEAWVVAPKGLTRRARLLAEKVGVTTFDWQELKQIVSQTPDQEDGKVGSGFNA